MDVLLRKWVEWKARRKAVQVIIYDGAAEYEKTRSFVRGVLAGALGITVLFSLTAPSAVDPELLEGMRQRQALVEQADQRAQQAMGLADMCLNTARRMDETLTAYEEMLRER